MFENSPAGADVGVPVTATDPDGDVIAYSLSGTGSELFDIDGNGQITVGQGTALDHESAPQYFITVHAADGNGGADSVAITVNVKNVVELTTVSVSDSAGGTEAGSVTFGLVLQSRLRSRCLKASPVVTLHGAGLVSPSPSRPVDGQSGTAPGQPQQPA